MKDMYGAGFDPQISALTSFSAAYALELHHRREAKTLPLVSPADDADASTTYKARAIGACRSGDLPTALANLQEIRNLHARLVKEKKPPISIKAVEDDQGVVSARINHTEGRNDEAIKILGEIARREQGIFAPDGGIPAHEMLGDILNEIGQPNQALMEYEAELKLNPNRFDSLYGAGRAGEMANLAEKVNAYYKQLLEVCAKGNSSRPELAYARGALSRATTQN